MLTRVRKAARPWRCSEFTLGGLMTAGLMVAMLFGGQVSGQEILPENAYVADKPEEPASREERLAKYLSGTQFVGRFTIDGQDAPPKEEAYTISKCEKLPAKDMYRMTARIKYGEVDSEVPLDLKIIWAGNTPVITLDSLWIPGMGTFDSRVMLHVSKAGARYAGTWQHGKVGGHLYGKIVPLP